jgi:hypothetical protein
MAVEHKETDIVIAAVFVGGVNKARDVAEPGDVGPQFGPCGGRIFGQPVPGEVELVGAVDQLDGAIDMRIDVVVDKNPDRRGAQEGLVVPFGLAPGVAFGFENPVLLQTA